MHSLDGAFEYELTGLLKNGATIKNLGNNEIFSFLEKMESASATAEAEGAKAKSAYGNITHYNILHKEKMALPEGMASRLQSAAEGTLDCLHARVSKIGPHVPKPKTAATTAAANLAESAPKAAADTAAGKAETIDRIASEGKGFADGVKRFMREEKWVGKKGLAFAAGSAVVSGAVYGASKLFSKKEEPALWTDKVENQKTSPVTRSV